MRIVLFSPEIPQNVGNIARTCAVTGSELILVRPIRFNLSDRHIKRAGLDYWSDVSVKIVDTLEEELDVPFYFFSTKGTKFYTEIPFSKEASLIFGSESTGLPQWVHEKWPWQFCTIPMCPGKRSLNLSNAVAIALYEGLRQNAFTELH